MTNLGKKEYEIVTVFLQFHYIMKEKWLISLVYFEIIQNRVLKTEIDFLPLWSKK